MNGFDAVVYSLAAIAVATGFRAGFLRSAATVLAYLSAMPVAITTTRLISGVPMDKAHPLWEQNWLVFIAIFLATGVVIGALLRSALSATVGPDIGLADRFAGSLFGAIRIALVAVTVVVVFDLLIPANQQPAFLNGSLLRPLLSLAGRKSLQSLPPGIMEMVDQLKRDSGA